MKTTVNITLRSKPNKDGRYGILLRVVHKRELANLAFNEAVFKEDWDQSLMQIKKSCKYVPHRERFNAKILESMLAVKKYIYKLEEDGQLATNSAKDILHKFGNRETKPCLIAYSNDLVQYYNSIGQYGNAAIYKQCTSFVKRYTYCEYLPFEEITPKVLADIQTLYLAKGYNANGLSVYFRTLKAIFNHAIKAGIVKPEIYPFANFTLAKTNTTKSFISKKAIKAMIAYPLQPETTPWHCRNMWLFMFYCNGMSIADLARLKPSNFNDTVLTYVRTKTMRKKQEKPIALKLPEEAVKVLLFYRENLNNGFLFPIIKHHVEPAKWRTDIHNAAKLIKKHLNRIMQELGFDVDITPGIARHSWANAARESTNNNKLIQQALGHSSITTTEIYMGSFANEAVDDLSAIISKL